VALTRQNGGAYRVFQTLLLDFRGPTLKGRKGKKSKKEKGKKEKKDKKKENKGRGVKFPIHNFGYASNYSVRFTT